MRNVNRIDVFCSRLAKAWKIYPDFRFGQMILNIFGNITSDGRDPFNLEENEMIQYIETYMNGLVSKRENDMKITSPSAKSKAIKHKIRKVSHERNNS